MAGTCGGAFQRELKGVADGGTAAGVAFGLMLSAGTDLEAKFSAWEILLIRLDFARGKHPDAYPCPHQR